MQPVQFLEPIRCPSRVLAGAAGCAFSSLPPHGSWRLSRCSAASARSGFVPPPKPPSRRSTAISTSPALSAPVTVRRDEHGVPHIDAATQQDMFVAQGYVTAQDRLWQMDVYRRNANGELAEVMGPSLLRHDKAQRMYEFRNTAHRIYANLPSRRAHPLRSLCARRESLHHAAPGCAPARIPLSPLQAAALDRRRLHQHRHDDGGHARHTLVHKALPRAHRRKAPQPEARVRPLPRWFLARPSAHRRTARP